MSQELQQNRYDRLIRRVGGLIGVGSKVSEVIGELFPMIDVENLPGELFVLAETRLGMGAVTNAGFAALQNHHQLFNPVDSGQIITISHINIMSNATQLIRYGLVTVPLAAAITNRQFRDSRLPIGPNTLGELRGAQLAATTPNVGRIAVIANTNNVLEDRNDIAVLGPGTGFELLTESVNSSFLTSFFWRERAAEASELQF